jgi:hypothetical protein
VVLHGDLNDQLKYYPKYSALASWTGTYNFDTPFHTTFKDDDNYRTRHTLSGNQRNTVLDHGMHTPLRNDVRVAYLGTLNSSFIRSTSHHLAQREIDRNNKDDIKNLAHWSTLPLISQPVK